MRPVKRLAHRHYLGGLALSLALAACGGGGALDPGAGNDPGTGTGTLFIDADMEATPVVPNASAPDNFQTELRVRVRKNDVPVITGTVTVVSNGGTTALLYDAGEGRWQGVQAGYHEVYELSVASGDDAVDGVRVDGPALHYFTAPTAGATVDATMPLAVTWSRDEGADSATLDTDMLDSVAIADSGTYSIPVGGLKSKSTETEQEHLRLDRAARVAPAGAIGGSEMRVRVRNDIDLIVAPTGL